MQESTNFFDAIVSDKLLRQYADDWTDLMQQLFLDARGNPVLKPELLADLPKLVGAIISNIAVIPIGSVDD